ncbi:MAG TPA: Ldh family oxidoreductase [Burkholderiales bacterium]|nr:Ldh family oxidoreductase [Burkholderiales bacterium]
MSKKQAPAGPPARTASADALKRFATDVFTRAGLPKSDAATVAEVLVWANLRGVDTHGVTRIPRYVDLVETGEMNPRPAMTVSKETPASVLIEADRAAGPVAMMRGTAEALRKARDAGIGLALVRATTHTAALGYYTLAVAREGMAGIAFAASWPNVAYHGTRAAGVSTSPISIAVPGAEPLVLDMATSVVSMGKLNQAKRSGAPIPAGWALDKDGKPTTDPQAAQIPLPMAGPKGSGLSLMVECITSLIASNPLLAESLEGTPAGHRHRQNGLVMAIDLAQFGDPEYFRREVDRLVIALKSLPVDPEVGEILMPGERGRRTLEQRSHDGIPIQRAVCDELQALANRLGVPMFPSVPR